MNPFRWLFELLVGKPKEDDPFGDENGEFQIGKNFIESSPASSVSSPPGKIGVPLFAAPKTLNRPTDSRRLQEEIWQELRQRVFERDGWRCQVNGCINIGGHLECHHIDPISNGGSNEIDNLITLCLFHHACQDGHDLRSMQERADNNRFYITPPYWRLNKRMRSRIGRKRLVTIDDLKKAKVFYDLHCECGSRDWQGFVRPASNELLVLCPDCAKGWKLPLGIHEETCVALAHTLVPAANHGRYSVNDLGESIAGLRLTALSVRPCPYCFLEDRKCGYLVPYFGMRGRALRCVNATKPNIQCLYRTSI